MKNTGNKIFSETAKTVLFIHRANCFIIDQTITADAVYIKPAKEEWNESGESVLYYLQEMKVAAESDKKYLIMEYELVIGYLIEELIKAPGQWNFTKWMFRAFFHADTCPQGEEPNPMYNIDDEKLEVLWQMECYPFIFMHTIPVGHTLTAQDLQRMEKDFRGPETEEELKELIESVKNNKKKEPLFPFYEADFDKLKEYVDRQPW